MARNFRKKDRMEAMNQINVTPLLDLCFCLLIIFMIATPVLEQTTQIELPVASTSLATKTSDDVKFKVVSIDAKGAYFIDGKEVLMPELKAELERIASLSEQDQPIVRVRADASLLYRQVIALFDLVKKEGLSKVAIDTEVES